MRSDGRTCAREGASAEQTVQYSHLFQWRNSQCDPKIEVKAQIQKMLAFFSCLHYRERISVRRELCSKKEIYRAVKEGCTHTMCAIIFNCKKRQIQG